MSMLDLPSDLSISILTEWLANLKYIVALDSAVAISVRADFLSLLAHPTFVLPTSLVLKKEATHTARQIAWINTRMVKLSGLVIDASKLDQACEIIFFRLRSVTRLTLSGTPRAPDNNAFLKSFEKLLKLLPSLENVNLKEFIPSVSDYINILANAGLQLKALLLDGATKVCNDIITLITSSSFTLEVVDFCRLHVSATILNLLTSTCHRVREITFASYGISTQELISCLGSERLPLLEHLEIRPATRGDQVAINDEVALAILQHHPKLIRIVTKQCARISCSVCAEAVFLCPQLREFRSQEITYRVQPRNEVPGNLYASVELAYYGTASAETSNRFTMCLVKIAACSKHPVEGLVFIQPLMMNDDFCNVLSAIGRSLRSLSCAFMGDHADDVVLDIAQKCSVLEAIHLRNCVYVSDHSLAAIAKCCHSLTSFNIYATSLISDVGICRFLAKIGEQLKQLQLCGCPCVTDASLLPIVAFCNQLAKLTVSGTKFSADAVKTQLIIPNVLPLLKRLAINGSDIDKLYVFVLDLNNGVDPRWATMLMGV